MLSIASGWLAAMWGSTKAGPSGVRRFASQAWTSLVLTFRKRAKTAWDACGDARTRFNGTAVEWLRRSRERRRAEASFALRVFERFMGRAEQLGKDFVLHALVSFSPLRLICRREYRSCRTERMKVAESSHQV